MTLFIDGFSAAEVRSYRRSGDRRIRRANVSKKTKEFS
jgi:hypothetical protein